MNRVGTAIPEEIWNLQKFENSVNSLKQYAHLKSSWQENLSFSA